MAVNAQQWRSTFLSLFLVFSAARYPLSRCQSNSPQNIETVYPARIISDPPVTSPSPPPPPPSSPATPSPVTPLTGKSSSPVSTRTRTIATSVVVTFAGTLLLSALLFFLIQKCLRRRRKGGGAGSGSDSRFAGVQRQPVIMAPSEFARVSGNLKGFIVDENGLDVIYWRKLESKKSNRLRKEPVHHLKDKAMREEEEEGRRKAENIQEVPLLREKSSTSQVKFPTETELPNWKSRRTLPAPRVLPCQSIEYLETLSSAPLESQTLMAVPANKGRSPIPPLRPPPMPPLISVNQKSGQPPPPVYHANSKLAPPPSHASMVVSQNKGGPRPPPPPPPQMSANTNGGPPPPPPPPSSANKNGGAPPPPPPPSSANKNVSPPPPPQNANTLKSGSKPPPPPVLGGKPAEESSSSNADQVRLKPLHWDKVNTRDKSHSMVWDRIDGGSFSFDGDLMEALFGTVAANRKSPQKTRHSAAPTGKNSLAPTKIFILDSKKSQNTAIVIKSMSISREEIVDALTDGNGLEADVLEKLARIAPNQEEQSQILNFTGDPLILADAESFLFKLLKTIPSAFTRLDSMLFRSTYESEILHLKEHLDSIEAGCKELLTRGLFMKLLEAILKAGNRMNAGTARGNAQAFNLTALRKLSDVKSTDGKTSLLHFVVEEVVRSEGKKCVLSKNASFSRNSSISSTSSINSDHYTTKEERMKEYMMLGLPVVGGLSPEFSNVKKAATIDYNTFAGIFSCLTSRTSEIRQTLPKCASDGGAFVKETKTFLESAEHEVKKLREEQTRVMELVKKTTEYYQTGALKDKEAHPLQLFVIVKEFLDMVDQVCVGIARNLQKKKSSVGSGGSSSAKYLPLKTQPRFPNLTAHFLSDKSISRTSSSDSDDD